jgi:hypothetical protein
MYTIEGYILKTIPFPEQFFLKYPSNYYLCKYNENYTLMQAATGQQSSDTLREALEVGLDF